MLFYRRFSFVVSIAIVMFLASLAVPVGAASSYANPAFQTQWQQGEAVTSNFWGPLTTAHDGQQEPYKEAAGGQRLVQYFDKGRMELTNGAVTNGLLATELVKGQVQVGDATFQPQSPPAIPVAGDPDNPGPTYAQLATTAKPLFDADPDHTGAYTQAAVSPSGTISVSDADRTDAATFAVYDMPTQHNVPKAFADYRAKAGVLTIGYALCEPFYATVKVAGQQRQVMVQVFERRVLTYTAANPATFQVEMGNIGAHYYRWRYPNGAPVASTPPTVAPPTTAPLTVAAAPATGNVPVAFTSVTSPVGRNQNATAIVLTAGGASCSITVTYKSGESVAAGLVPKTADSAGVVSWTWRVGGNTTFGSWPIDVACSLNGKSGSAHTTFTVG